MKFGLTDKLLQFVFTKVVNPMLQKGAKVYCYGSRARGDNQEFSDLDLMVEANTDLSKDISQILELMSNGNFPYKVDLVDF